LYTVDSRLCRRSTECYVIGPQPRLDTACSWLPRRRRSCVWRCKRQLHGYVQRTSDSSVDSQLWRS